MQHQEVDFYCHTDSGRMIANVSLDLHDPNTRKRELGGLAEALTFFNCEQGYLLTRDHEETVNHDGKTILILPLWKWLLTFV